MTQERRSKKPIGEWLVAEELISQGELLEALASRMVIDGKRERLGETIDPLRFRANIAVEGLPAWSELDSVGRVISCGDVRLKILLRTKRCAATEVNPQTAERDLRLPYLLRKTLGHMDMGVYAEVLTGGSLAIGDQLDWPLA